MNMVHPRRGPGAGCDAPPSASVPAAGVTEGGAGLGVAGGTPACAATPAAVAGSWKTGHPRLLGGSFGSGAGSATGGAGGAGAGATAVCPVCAGAGSSRVNMVHPRVLGFGAAP
jgi:hypothetical protein